MVAPTKPRRNEILRPECCENVPSISPCKASRSVTLLCSCFNAAAVKPPNGRGSAPAVGQRVSTLVRWPGSAAHGKGFDGTLHPGESGNRSKSRAVRVPYGACRRKRTLTTISIPFKNIFRSYLITFLPATIRTPFFEFYSPTPIPSPASQPPALVCSGSASVRGAPLSLVVVLRVVGAKREGNNHRQCSIEFNCFTFLANVIKISLDWTLQSMPCSPSETSLHCIRGHTNSLRFTRG